MGFKNWLTEKINRKYVMYSSAICSDCQEAEKFFAENNIDIEIKKIEEEKYKKELKEKYGRVAVPTMIIKGKKFLGFEMNKQEIIKLLNIGD